MPGEGNFNNDCGYAACGSSGGCVDSGYSGGMTSGVGAGGTSANYSKLPGERDWNYYAREYETNFIRRPNVGACRSCLTSDHHRNNNN